MYCRVNPKGRLLQKSTSSWKATFKVPPPGFEDKVLDCGKKIHAAEFVNDCDAIIFLIVVKYKYRITQMAMAINNMENPEINVLKVL